MSCCCHANAVWRKRGSNGQHLMLEHLLVLRRGGFFVQEHSIGGNGDLGVLGNANNQIGLDVSDNFLSTLELASTLVSLQVDAGGVLEGWSIGCAGKGKPFVCKPR